MSRVGKNPIKIPAGTEVHVNNNEVVARQDHSLEGPHDTQPR